MIRHSDFERTISYAVKALDHMRANQLPAYPRNYELWYTYVSGLNRALNRVLNEAITRYGQVPESVVDEIYESHLSPAQMTDRVDELSSSFMKEFERVLSAVDDAKGNTSNFGRALKDATQDLSGATTDEQVKLVIQSLTAATTQMEQRSQELEEQLAESKQQIDQLHQNLETVRAENLTDALTGIANRKHFDAAIKEAVKQADETGEPLALLVGDIDFFKKFNDNYGHQTGDQVLHLVAQAMKTNIKGRDLAARYGGEEFVIILPQTDLSSAVIVGNYIRQVIMGKELVKKSTGEKLGNITMSFGAALYRPGEQIGTLIARADTCLYAAKNSGRNQIKHEDEVDTGPATADVA